MELLNIFTDFLIVDNITTDLDKLRKDVLHYKEKTPTTPEVMTNRGGYQSPSLDYDDIKENYETFPLFLNELNERVMTVSKNLSSNGEPEGEICLGNTWINVNNKTHYNQTHCHPMSYLSGCVYLNVPEDSGNIVFRRNRVFTDYAMTHVLTGNNSAYNGHYYVHQPKEGQILIFPSYLDHEVEMSNSEEDRMSIAFNTINMSLL